MKQHILLIMLILICITLQGCHTLTGMKDGFKKDLNSMKNKDSYIHKADNWVKENMW